MPEKVADLDSIEEDDCTIVCDDGGRGHPCGLVVCGDRKLEQMAATFVMLTYHQPPIAGSIERGYYRWVPNQWEESRSAPMLLYEAEKGEPGAFYATYLDLR